MQIQPFLDVNRLEIELTGDSKGEEVFKLTDVGDVDDSEVKWSIVATSDMPPGLVVTRDVAKVAWQLNFDVRISTPVVPKWKRFILQAEYGGKRAQVQIEIYRVLFAKVALGSYFELANPLQWTSPKGQRALSLLQAFLDEYSWGLVNPLPSRAAVQLVKNPSVDGESASYFQYDEKGDPVIVLDRAHVDELELSPPLQSTDMDQKFAEYFLHEVGHAIMSFQCREPNLRAQRAFLTEIRKQTGYLRSSVIGAPFSVLWGMFDWIYQVTNGLWGRDREDFMSSWCRASGWVIDEPEKGLGWLGWKTEPPNIYLAEVGELFNLRNTKLDTKDRKRLQFLDKKGIQAAQDRLDQLIKAKPPNPAAIDAQRKVLQGLKSEAAKLKAKGGFINEYASTNPDEDFAECVSLPYARGLKIPDPDRRRFLAELGLPVRKTPPDLSKWMGVTIRPVTHIADDGRTTKPPKIPGRQMVAESVADDSETPGTADAPWESVWKECVQAFREYRAAAQEVTGPAVESVIEVIRDIESIEDWSHPMSGLRMAATHGVGPLPFRKNVPIQCEVGEILFARKNLAYVVASVNDQQEPLCLVGAAESSRRGETDELPKLDPSRILLRWQPSSERRVWVPTAEGENPHEIPLNQWLFQASMWWGLESVPVGRQEFSVTTGPLFARAWLKTCDFEGKLAADLTIEELEKALARTGPPLKPWTGEVSALQVGDLVSLTRDDAIGIVSGIAEDPGQIELIVGGVAREGDFGEAAGAVRVLFLDTGEPIPIRWIWRQD